MPVAALSAAFKIKYRSAIRLDAPAAANYAGSFNQVVERLLDGYSYIIKHEGETAEVIVLGRRGDVPIAVPSSKPSMPNDITSPLALRRANGVIE